MGKFFFDHVSLGMRLFHFADFSHPYCWFSNPVWWLSSVLLVFPTIYPGLISPLPLGSTLGSLEISVWFSVYLWNLLLKTPYFLQESYCLAPFFNVSYILISYFCIFCFSIISIFICKFSRGQHPVGIQSLAALREET